MCQVSDKLKLCTCVGDFARLKNSWAIHHFGNDDGWISIGEPVLPYKLTSPDQEKNYEILLGLLNEGNPFDVDITLQEDDKLLFLLTCEEHDKILQFGFSYRGGKWMRERYDWQEPAWWNKMKHGGSVVHALQAADD